MSADGQPDYDAALALARAGRLQEAAAALQAVLTENGDDRAAWSLMAAVRQRLGQGGAALACHRELARLAPDDAQVHMAHGNQLAAHGFLVQALASFARAAELAPDLAFAHNNRANMLNKLARPDEALVAADRALALDARLAHAWRHRGQALSQLGFADEAVEAYHRAVETAGAPELYDALCDLGSALSAAGQYAAAVEALDEAARQRPDDAQARLRRGEIRLLEGRFAEGWDDYEARWRQAGFVLENRQMSPELLARLSHAPRAEDLTGQRVLIICEQGVGDVVMFASVLPDLAAVAAQVTCVVEPRLVRLLAQSLPRVTFAAAGPNGVDPGAFDRVVALGSLPGMFRRAVADFPRRPYLAPAPPVTAGWRRRLDAAGAAGLRIGISWRGGVKRTRAVARSLDLAQFLAPLDRPDRTFVSLQYGDVADEIAALNRDRARPVLAFPSADMDDFEDLAGLVGALDVVVTVQTSLAHLCGAVGAPALVMLTRWPEWRYGLQGEDMAWYAPSLRLLRQAEAGDWSPVLAEVSARLDRLAAK